MVSLAVKLALKYFVIAIDEFHLEVHNLHPIH